MAFKKIVLEGEAAVSSFTGAAIQTSGESFSDSDTVLMTAAAIDDRISAQSGTGTVTSVTAGSGLSGGTITGSGTISANTAAVADGASTLATGDQIHAFVTAGFPASGNVRVADFNGNAVITSSESFSDTDDAFMTAKALNDRIESFGYTTNTGDITAVSAGTGLSGGGQSGAVTLDVSGLSVSEFAGSAIQTSGESFSDDDTSIMTSAAIQDKIQSFGFTTNSGDITAVTITTDSGAGSKASDGSGSADFTFVGGTGMSVTNLNNSISFNASQNIATSASPTFNNLTLSGNLTVNGNTITTDTETLLIKNNTLVLNSDNSGTADAGFVVERGSGGDDFSLVFQEAKDRFIVGVNSNNQTLASASGGTYHADMALVHVNSSFSNSLTKVPIGHFQFDGSDLYVRTS